MIINKDNINWTNIQSGAEKYLWIMKFIEKAKLDNTDLSKIEVFKKKFNGFYKIRQKPEKFYTTYYSYLSLNLNTSPDFSEVLECLYKVEQRFESSFSSKLLHSINPNLPIWDSIVMKKLGLNIKNYPKDNNAKRVKIIDQYEKLFNFYVEFLLTQEGQELVKLFDNKIKIQDYHITPLKKIDFIIWQTRE